MLQTEEGECAHNAMARRVYGGAVLYLQLVSGRSNQHQYPAPDHVLQTEEGECAHSAMARRVYGGAVLYLQLVSGRSNQHQYPAPYHVLQTEEGECAHSAMARRVYGGGVLILAVGEWQVSSVLLLIVCCNLKGLNVLNFPRQGVPVEKHVLSFAVGEQV